MMMGSMIAAMLLGAGATESLQSRSTAGPRCTFATLSAEDRRRYQSRYNRRVRTEGRAFAEDWVQKQACPSPAQQAAKTKRLVAKDGRPCNRTRMEMRVTPGFDGAMTMSPVPVCAH